MVPQRILVIEDDPLISLALKRALHASGYAVECVSNLAASRYRLQKAPLPDLLTLDIGLPDGDGLDLLETLKSMNSEMPVLIVTSHDDQEQRLRAFEAGADDYVVKPVHPRELVLRVRNILHRCS